MEVERSIKIVMVRVSFNQGSIRVASFFGFLGIVFSTHCIQAQIKSVSKDQTQQVNTESGLQVNEDARLTAIVNKRIEFNKKLALSPLGYRIVIYSGRVRQLAYAAQEKFKRAYPEQEAYLTFAFPNFKITAGDYKSKEQATQVLGDLKKLFPEQILLIVSQKIDLTKSVETEPQ